MRKSGYPFIALGVAFVVMGTTTNRTFLYAGLAFIFIGLAIVRRGGRR
jgi:hypothetical protein